MSEDQPQASHLDSGSEPDLASTPEGFGVAPDSPTDESTPMTDTGVTADSESLAAASMVPEASSPESSHMADELQSPQPNAEPGRSVEPPAADDLLQVKTENKSKSSLWHTRV